MTFQKPRHITATFWAPARLRSLTAGLSKSRGPAGVCEGDPPPPSPEKLRPADIDWIDETEGWMTLFFINTVKKVLLHLLSSQLRNSASRAIMAVKSITRNRGSTNVWPRWKMSTSFWISIKLSRWCANPPSTSFEDVSHHLRRYEGESRGRNTHFQTSKLLMVVHRTRMWKMGRIWTTLNWWKSAWSPINLM